jgi:protein SCO1
MSYSAVRLSETYAIPQSQRAALAMADHVYGDAQPSPDELGGYFDFSDWRDRPVSSAHFLGRWSFLYFGYSRCQGSCRSVAPLIANAAYKLRKRGYAAKAAFVDIEVAPVGITKIITGDDTSHSHRNNWPKRFAMSELYASQKGRLDVLTGNRTQLAQATAAFHVIREHVPPRAGEDAMSINHSSIIYLIGPDSLVAGYGYHDAKSETLVDLVESLSKAERKIVDLAAVRRRYIRGACGGDI